MLKSERTSLKRVVQEWHSQVIPELSVRHISMELMTKPPIVAVIGPRRAGKTWLCFQTIRHLISQGVSRNQILYLNLEDERLHPLTGFELTDLLDTHRELYQTQEGKDFYCFVDEIQNAENWSKWVRRITDQNPSLHVIVTGSSAKMLGNEIATELRGRCKVVSVFPYSWKEYLHTTDWRPENTDLLLNSPQRPEIRRRYHDFETLGGFPGIRKTLDPRETLQEYFRAMFARDMIERFAVKNISLFVDFLKLQISRFSSLSSINKLEKELKLLGHACSKKTLLNYLGYAREVLLLFEVPVIDYKVKNQLLYPRKIYGIDQGLLNAIRFSVSEDKGRILENMVFLELKRRNYEIFYFSGKGECDFVIREGLQTTLLIQACYHMIDTKTRKREIDGLLEAMQKLKCSQGAIITDDQYENIEFAGHKISVRPFWFWALHESLTLPN